MKRVLVVFGTRPEAIKMAPIVKALKTMPACEAKVCLTAQHRQMLDQVMAIFELHADFDLNVMSPAQTLTAVTCKVLTGMERILTDWRPDMVLVQGDTTTVMATALAAFYQKIPVGHVEAGLRTRNIYSPWPEEMNRLLAGCVATMHFAPTLRSRDNLLKEYKASETVFVTGNTVIDALYDALEKIDSNVSLSSALKAQFSYLDLNKRLILVTGHRRENFGEGFVHICKALATLASRTDVEIVYPMHMNPNVRQPVQTYLGHLDNVHLIEPLDYLSFVYLMRQSYLVMTDSGGVQEEAPSLGKPVVVMRDTTERPEAVDAGTVILAGTEPSALIDCVTKLLDNPSFYRQMAHAINPYGDGLAAKRIAQLVMTGTTTL